MFDLPESFKQSIIEISRIPVTFTPIHRPITVPTVDGKAIARRARARGTEIAFIHDRLRIGEVSQAGKAYRSLFVARGPRDAFCVAPIIGDLQAIVSDEWGGRSWRSARLVACDSIAAAFRSWEAAFRWRRDPSSDIVAALGEERSRACCPGVSTVWMTDRQCHPAIPFPTTA